VDCEGAAFGESEVVEVVHVHLLPQDGAGDATDESELAGALPCGHCRVDVLAEVRPVAPVEPLEKVGGEVEAKLRVGDVL